jgi:hypothetical protein
MMQLIDNKWAIIARIEKRHIAHIKRDKYRGAARIIIHIKSAISENYYYAQFELNIKYDYIKIRGYINVAFIFSFSHSYLKLYNSR